jgi:DNA-directed RNA polymerase II subunit RPB2
MSSDELYNAGECKFELGGYFIVSGQERVLLTQERLGDNMFYASKRIKPPSTTEVRTTVEKEEEIKVKGATKEDEYEYIANIRSISEDGTRGPFSHFITIPPKNIRPNDDVLIARTPDYGVFYTKRLAMITLPGFVQPVPLLSVFYALGLTNDRDIYDTILIGVPEDERTQYDEIFMELVFSHEKFLESRMAKEEDKTEDPNMLILYTFVKSRTKAGVYMNLYNDMFPHCQLQEGESSASFYRRKAYLLGILTRMAMEVAIGKTPKTDREHYRFKRLDASGELCFQEFRRVFKENAKAMKLLMNSRVYYQKDFYEGKNVAELISDENVEFMWKPYMFLSEFEKSFKGKWGGKDGVSQVLSRYSYMGASAHLRRVNLQMDKDTKQVEIRRIHGSSWGLMCPVDNPDGGNVGMIKSLSLLSSISTASPSSLLLEMVSNFDSFTPLHLIHPSTWDPRWRFNRSHRRRHRGTS